MIGDNIKRIRLKRGMTLKALAKAVGIHTGYLSNVENNKRMPSIPVLMAIAEALADAVETPVLNLILGGQINAD